MVRFAKEQRELLADKLPDAANVAVGALVFGQFLSERVFSVGVAVCGVGLWTFLLALALWYRRRTR